MRFRRDTVQVLAWMIPIPAARFVESSDPPACHHAQPCTQTAYRALNLGNTDRERVLRNLEKLSREQLDGMGARRLRKVLEG